jgi:signal transduction histidine kinase
MYAETMSALARQFPEEPFRAGEREAAPEADQSESATILVVEDEPEILEPLVHSLKREGYRVIEAEDGLAACRLIGTKEPDLILLDIMLPDLDGWEVCRMLRQHPDQHIATTPVIMLTALNAQQDKIRGLALGADAYLAKPYSLREIQLYAANLIERRHRTVQLEKRLRQISRKEFERINFHHLLLHELRNRLFVLNGYTELLSSDQDTDKCVEAISRSSEYLTNLAEDILLIRQVEDGHFILSHEALLLAEILEEMHRLYAPQAGERDSSLDIRLEPDDCQPIRLNRPALKIILSTLVDNALKYGPAGQIVTISCRQSADLLEIVIADDGPGIPEEETGKLFTPFYRAGNAGKQVPGSGLGLYGVRVLSRAMGGDVMLESVDGRPSCFRVQLPLHTN